MPVPPATGAPTFLGDPVVDRLMEVTLELAAELWVSRRRQATLEQLLVERGVLPASKLDEPSPGTEDREAMRAARDEFFGRVLAGLSR